MKRPVFIDRLKDNERKRVLLQLAELKEILARQEVVHLDKMERLINRNNRLWNALSNLPGGLEVARKLKNG